MNALNTQITRLLTVSLLGAAALTLQGCADGPGNGTTSSGGNGNSTAGTTTTGGGTTTGNTSGGGSTSGGTSTGGTAPCPTGMVCDGSTTPIPVNCPVAGQTFTQIPVGDAYVTHVDATPTAGPCIGCSVVDAVDVIDIFTDNFAIMSLAAGVLGSNSLTVTDVKTQFPAGSYAGFIVALPNAPVAGVSVLQTVGVTAISNGQDTDSAGPVSNPVTLSLVGAGTGSAALQFASVKTTVPYNAARIIFGGGPTISVLTQLDVYGAGVCQ